MFTRRLLNFIILIALPFITFTQTNQGVTASFTSVDSVCAGSSVNFKNTSVGASNYYWSFCAAGFNTTPQASNLGNPSGNLTTPVFMDYTLDDNGNYYGFSTNYTEGHLIKLSFGKSLLNSPTSKDLGNISAITPYVEGVQVVKYNGKCYVFVVSSGNEYGTDCRLVRVDFGNSFQNTPVSATSFGNVGNLYFPHELFITQSNNVFYGFTVNVNDNTITRFDFGNSITNTPTGVNLGNIGDLDYPCGLSFINSNGNWHAFIANRNSNSISRLDFGKDLSNTPTGTNLGDPSNTLNRPRDISIFQSCDGVVGLVVNEEDESTGTIAKLNFGSDLLSSNVSAQNLGNIGKLKFPHSISKFFLEQNDIYCFITNVTNNTLTRLRYVGCTSSNVSSSTQQTPPAISYNSPGVYNVNLLVDIGLPTETSFCKQIVVKDCAPPVTASFTGPDSICTSSSIKLTNTSTNATSYYWSFCQADIKQIPQGENLNNPNSNLSLPVYSDIVNQNGNYYVFVVNNYPGGVTRLDFGNSLLNTPSSINLGDLGVISNNAEGIQIENVNNNWIAILVGGSPVDGVTPQIVKLNFGSDITNTSPTAIDWGNIGNMSYPHELYIFKENNAWYGFTANYENSTITRFDFGLDFSQTPIGTNLGNFGLLNGPAGLSPIKENSNWYLFVANGLSNSITRLDFGNSLISNPTAHNLGNINNTMHACWDISIQRYCDQIIGFVVNGDDNYNDIIRLDFNNDLTSIPTAESLGNIGDLSFPHSFSKLFRVGNDIYNFIPNAHNNTLTRLKFSGCNNSNIPNTSQANPPSITYDSAGVYNISLTVDEGLPTQTSYCKQIIVKDCSCDTFKISAGKDVSICYGDSTQLDATGAATYSWNATNALNDTTIYDPVANPSITSSFIVTGFSSSGICSAKDTVKVNVLKLPVFNLINDTTICNGNTVQFSINSGNNYHYHWSPDYYLSDTSISNPISSTPNSIQYFVTASDSNNCHSIDSVHVNVIPKPSITTLKDSSICHGSTILLSSTATNATHYIWYPSSGLNNDTLLSPLANPTSSTNYIISASNNACVVKDSVLITVKSLPTVSADNDTTTCGTGSAQLNATGASTYQWQPTTGLSDSNIPNPIASPTITTTYYVTGKGSNECKSSDSVIIYKISDPVFTIHASDSLVCKKEQVTLKATGGDLYSWSPSQSVSNPNDSTTKANPLINTVYTVNITDSICKVSKILSTSVNLKPSPTIRVSKSNDVDCSIMQAQLTATGGVVYSWQPTTYIDNPSIANPIVNPLSDTWYTVTVTGANSCASEDSIFVKSSLSTSTGKFYVPNAFTPNGDGINDCFGVHFWGPTITFEMSVFNRWGQRIFYSKNVNNCWDGTINGILQPAGTYVYMIKASSVCSKDPVFRKGTVVLIR